MAVKESSASKIKFKGVDALFGLSEEQECVREIPLDELDTFKNHPFKVFRDDKMEEMIESISEYGVLVPGIARPSNSGEKDYELVVGHRRKYACRELGLKTMPVIIRDMSDDEATVVMVDSNIQRENLLYSEKAFAYRMKYEALKRQGRRTDLTLVQVEPKLKKRWAAEMVGTEVGETMSTIKRYIRLTYLACRCRGHDRRGRGGCAAHTRSGTAWRSERLWCYRLRLPCYGQRGAGGNGVPAHVRCLQAQPWRQTRGAVRLLRLGRRRVDAHLGERLRQRRGEPCLRERDLHGDARRRGT